MSVVSRLSSPSANLLRNSRLFALPQPLAPSVTNASSTPINHSDTATTPYPTHATIETYRESRNQGDWGLKRPLPLKSTAGKDASFIRIKDGIDTREHITNFESAGDHVWTLRKFQALNTPVVFEQALDKRILGDDSTPFEEKFNSTASPEKLPEGAKRWRTKGPWIAGMSNADFEKWLYGSSAQGGVLSKKDTFMLFLKEHFLRMLAEKAFAGAIMKDAGADDKTMSEKERTTQVTRFLEARLPTEMVLTPMVRSIVAIADGGNNKDDLNNLLKLKESGELVSLVPEAESSMTKEQENVGFKHYIRELRATPNDFLPLIQEFFDLPDTPNGPKAGYGEEDLSTWAFGYGTPLKGSKLANPRYKQSGMPKTHPSAGLGYLRLGDAVLENHAVYGPQAVASPVPARLLRPAQHAVDASAQAVFGAAGFVTSMSYTMDKGEQPKEFKSQRGGQKWAVTPRYVSINPDGRPVLWISSSGRDIYRDRQIMTGIAQEDRPERQAGSIEGRSNVQGFDQMPELDGEYQPNRRGVTDALQQSREGLRRMTNAVAGHGSAQSKSRREAELLTSIISEVKKR